MIFLALGLEVNFVLSDPRIINLSEEAEESTAWDAFTNNYQNDINYVIGGEELNRNLEVSFLSESILLSSPTEIEVEKNSTVQLVADAFPGYIFSHWEINGQNVSQKSTYEFTMPSNNLNIIGVFLAEEKPTIEFVQPQNNQVFNNKFILEIEFLINNNGTEILYLDFLINGIVVKSLDAKNNKFNWDFEKGGIYDLKLVGNTASGAIVETERLHLEILSENILPTVSITAPSAGSEYEIGESVSITAEATDSDGSITKVDFYVNGSLLGTSTSAPYSANWNTTASGTFELTAVATDNRGGASTSAPVSVTVIADNILPTVSITAPSAGSEYGIGESVSITAEATDSDGSITKVDFYVNGSLLGTSTSAPYSANWNTTASGTFELTAVARDNRGGVSTSTPVSITVIPDNILPTVSITVPVSGTEIEVGNTLSITADASDEDGEVVKVEFFVNGNSIGIKTEAPYSINWTADEAGTFEIRAVATDNEGASAKSETLTVTVFETPENILPTVSITAPVLGTEIEAGNTLTIIADASDEDGEVVKVEFFVNGNSIGIKTEAPYSINWTADEAGAFEIRAVATDNDGASANSQTVTVTVFETPENILPTVSITAPAQGTEIEAGQTISITADASDEDGEVVKVEFFVNGTSIGSATQAPYSISWTADEAGTFDIRAVATDNEGASANSETVSVTVFETPENILPLVSITAPAAGTEIEAGETISITADASDEDGEVVKVEFFVNGSSIGTSNEAPYSINWTADKTGTFEIRAVATDNDGASANSQTVTVTVFETPENILPTVSITAPAQGTEIEAGQTISITADASDEDGEVVKVEFFVTGSSIGISNEAPYSINWAADEAGTFEIRAVATDNEGASANSETVTVTVFETPENILPTVSITAPAQGTEIEAGYTLTITADASDEDGEVVKVEFFVNGSSIGISNEAPYSINWTADEAGTFEIRAVATDNDGASASSQTVTVTVFETPENILPTVSITAPSTGTEIEAGQTISITADASDEDGEVVKVEFFVNGTSIGSATQAPYSISWTADEAGTFDIRAVATDNEGASANSETVSVTVFETPENILPLVSITAPAAGTEIEAGQTISITADASDEDGEVVKVEFFVNGTSIGSVTQAPYSISWTADEAGTFYIRAVATDNEGASANSETVSVTVFETPENILPLVSITAPAAGTEIEAGQTISITADASD
ncbi:hypothetical protein EGN73_03040, partial [Arthrospiribacter ruber]|nr:hypothetical protein [Arthrospiribacter ruber]